MVDRRVTRSRVVGRRPVRNMSWAGAQFPLTVIPVATKVILGSFVASTEWDETVTRVRGQVVYLSDQIGTLEAPIAAIGMIVVSEDAFAAGIAAIPGPVSDIGNDGWFMWQAMTGYFDLIAGGDPNFINIDSKAKRIVQQGWRVVIMAEGAIAPSTEGGRLTGFLRVLSQFRT